MRVKELLKPTLKKILITLAIFICIHVIVISVDVFPFFFAMESNSMSPAIHIGDMIFVSSINFENLKVGDVILSKPPQYRRMWVHRIISIDYNNESVSAKGDANTGQTKFEKNIPSDSICCIVIGSIPGIGYLELFYVGLIIRLLIIYLIVSLVIRGPKPNSAASRAATDNTS